MLNSLFYAGLVPLTLFLLYVAVPLWATRSLLKGRDLLDRLAYALLLGVGSQALLGTLWHVLIPGYPLLNSLVYLMGWVGIGLWSPLGTLTPSPVSLSRKEGVLLGVVFLFGFASRLIHPLETVALGQSDAYTHLYMLRQLVEGGEWAASYPPAFSRLLLLPCVLFNIDPYIIARFGGAFFGVGLALSSAWMIRKCSGSAMAALLTATLICCFPGFNLLMKTGVGVFPNQVGLLMLPYLFAFLYGLQTSTAKIGLGSIAILGLLLFVPMMLLHVGLIGLVSMVLWSSAQRRDPTRFFWIGCVSGSLLLICGIMLLTRSIPAELLSSLVRVFISGGETADGVQGLQHMSFVEALHLLVRDYFSVKRWGLGSSPLNSAVFLLAVGFIGTCGVGIRNKIPFAVLIGSWGSVTLLQTATGFAQFTAYQREGWSLMLATAVLGGWLGSLLLTKRPLLSGLLIPAIGILAVSSILLPPRHILRNSTTEEEWVSLALWMKNQEPLALEDPLYEFTQHVRTSLTADEPLFVVTRPLLQNAMFKAVSSHSSTLHFSDLNIWQNYRETIPAAQQVLLLLDPSPAAKAGSESPFATVNPEAMAMFAEQESRSYLFNKILEEFVLGMDPSSFAVRSLPAPSGIRAYFIRKKSVDLSENP